MKTRFLKECCFRVKVRVDTLTKKKTVSFIVSFFFSFLFSPGSFYWKRLNPSPFAPLSSPGWRLGPHFCWDNLLVYPDLPSFICLNEINSHSRGQIHPKLELSKFSIPANRAHRKRDSTNSNYCCWQSMGRGRGGGGLGPPIILTGTFNLVSGHALHAALQFMCSYRFDKSVKIIWFSLFPIVETVNRENNEIIPC